jgi:hypothetical protein
VAAPLQVISSLVSIAAEGIGFHTQEVKYKRHNTVPISARRRSSRVATA